MIKIDTRVKQETIDIIKKTAKENGRSFCGEIRFALEQYYKLLNLTK